MDSPPGPTVIMGASGGDPFSHERLQQALPQYELLELLGRGGMGVVYKARQRSLKRLVAIKFLPRDVSNDEFQFVERFRNEAQTMAAMNHPAIVSVYDFGETPDGLLYFVMEFVDGTDVQKMIQTTGKLTADYALAIAAHVCDALAYAHQRGVIHRDIKPANVLINQDGHVKVADFGLAKMHDPAATSGLTQTNMTMGTPDFLAPEALLSAQSADHRADLYAVGVMLYQMLTGEVPRGMFKLPSQKGLGTDPRFDAIICKAMEANRDERYQSAIEVRSALDEILTTSLPKREDTGAISVSTRPAPSGAVPARRPEKKLLFSGKAKWLLTAAAIAVAGGVGLVNKKRSPQSTTAPVPSAEARIPAESEQEEFFARIAEEPPEKQVTLVQEKLTALNPEKITLRPSFKEGRLAVLVVHAEASPGESPQLWPLAAFRRLDGLQVYTKRIADISWLRGMKVNLLTLPQGSFTDLSVLKDLPLTHLDLSIGPKRDYTALAGKPLQRLRLTGCPVSDLSFVAGMPLTELFIDGTGLTDFSPLRSLPLKDIAGDFVPARDAEILRSIPTLAKINGRPAAEFWAGAGRPAPLTGQSIDWINALPKGMRPWASEWNLKDGTLTSSTQRAMQFGVMKDGAVRLRVRLLPEYSVNDNGPQLQLTLRSGSLAGPPGRTGHVQFQTYVPNRIASVHFQDKTTPGLPVEKLLDGKPQRVSELGWREVEWEFRAVGDEYSAWADGQMVASVRDARILSGYCVLEVRPGIQITRLETVGLTPTQPGGVSSPSESAWIDWLGPKLAGGGYSGDGWVRLSGGLTTEREINGIRLLPPGTKDAAVRVTYVLRDSQGLMLNGRERMEGKVRLLYSAIDKVTRLHLDRLKPDGRNAALQHVILPAEVDREAERTLELRVIGNQLTATLNGTFTGTATDDTLSEGEWTLVFMKGVLVKKVEVQSLDAAR